MCLKLSIVTVSALAFRGFGKLGARAMSMSTQVSTYPIYCDESVMSQKAHGTCEKPVMKSLRYYSALKL